MSKISEKAAEIARPIVERLGLRLWDTEYVKEAGEWYLRIYIDKDGGIDISDCEAVSREIDPLLDDADFIPGSYVFEVCSAGAERELKRPGDFEQFIGSEVEAKLYQPVDGRKSIVGTLEAYNDGDIMISGTELKKEQVAQVRLHISI